MGPVSDEDVEKLLTPAARARLPFRQLVLLYFDPFALFKDASRGTDSARRRARSYNRAMRWMLLPYMRRWFLIAISLFACVTPAEALAADAPIFKIPAAACAVGSCMALTVIAWTLVAYFLLDTRD
ncbi:MAG TPA: hypothetical protein VIQ62_05335 [Burkholderiales bacterium]